MSLADKLHLLRENKANIKNSLANKLESHDPGNILRLYPEIIDNLETNGGLITVEVLPDISEAKENSVYYVSSNNTYYLVENNTYVPLVNANNVINIEYILNHNW